MHPEDFLFQLALMFVAAKAAGWGFERLGQPAVVGEVLAGIALGPSLLGVVEPSELHVTFQELGAVVLLFMVGLDTPLSDLRAVGGRALAVGALGIVLPFVGGVGLLSAAGGTSTEAAFLGTAMVATSVGVTARVLADLGKTEEDASRVILGAAVVDDVLGLIVLAVVVGSATGGFELGSIATLALLSLAFVALVGGLGPRLVAAATPLLDRLGRAGVFTIAIAICLALSAVAGALQLAAIIGAFLAGMAFAETRDRYRLEESVSPVYSLLVPFFFVVTGAQVDIGVLSNGSTLTLAVLVTVTAIAGKLVGCGGAAWSMGRTNAAIVGVGMVPRGEVGILVASIGLSRGLVEPDLYGVVVFMSITTTVLVPPVLKTLFGVKDRVEPPEQRGPAIEGIGG